MMDGFNDRNLSRFARGAAAVFAAILVGGTAWAAENVEGFVEVGEVGRANAKLPVPAVETVRDGNRFLFTVRGETPPPGDLFVVVRPLEIGRASCRERVSLCV